MIFPTITTKDLNGDTKTLPNDFTGELNFILLAYDQWHQQEVDTWLPFIEEVRQEMPTFEHYELPLVGNMGWMGQKQLDFWMRRAIPDLDTRSRTLTLYTDRADFRAKLDVPDENHIALFLLDAEGEILWRGEGAYSTETAIALVSKMNELQGVLA